MCQRIDGVKLCKRASQVRGTDVPCTIDLSPEALSAAMGGVNCHAEIVFEDGVVWLARFRILNVKAPPLKNAGRSRQERHLNAPDPCNSAP